MKVPRPMHPMSLCPSCPSSRASCTVTSGWTCLVCAARSRVVLPSPISRQTGAMPWASSMANLCLWDPTTPSTCLPSSSSSPASTSASQRAHFVAVSSTRETTPEVGPTSPTQCRGERMRCTSKVSQIRSDPFNSPKNLPQLERRRKKKEMADASHCLVSLSQMATARSRPVSGPRLPKSPRPSSWPRPF